MISLRTTVRKIKLLRNTWAVLRLLQFYGQSAPNWFRWRQGLRHKDGKIRGQQPGEPLHIVFVTRYARAREFKLAYAARLCGYRVTLVAPNVQSADLVAQHFNAHYKEADPWRILMLLNDLKPDITHLFVNYNNAQMLPVLLHAPSPVVYDPYDCIQGMIVPEHLNYPEVLAERVCFARADHVCARSLEPLYLRRQFGYRMRGTTYFPDYCWEPPQRNTEKVYGKNDELHVVYCGGIWPEDRFPASEFGYAQYIDIGRALAKQAIHLHLYPAPTPVNANINEFFALYLTEARVNPYFHFHEPLPNDGLLKVLRQYDAAMHIMGVSVNGNLGRATRAKLDYSTANKLFDYIEAGLPVIIHDGRHQRGLVRHYGRTVEVTHIDHVREALLQVLNADHSIKPDPAIAVHAAHLDNMYRSLL